MHDCVRTASAWRQELLLDASICFLVFASCAPFLHMHSYTFVSSEVWLQIAHYHVPVKMPKMQGCCSPHILHKPTIYSKAPRDVGMIVGHTMITTQALARAVSVLNLGARHFPEVIMVELMCRTEGFVEICTYKLRVPTSVQLLPACGILYVMTRQVRDVNIYNVDVFPSKIYPS